MVLWKPDLEVTTDAVFATHETFGIPLHEAYRIYGSTRLSLRLLRPRVRARPRRLGKLHGQPGGLSASRWHRGGLDVLVPDEPLARRRRTHLADAGTGRRPRPRQGRRNRAPAPRGRPAKALAYAKAWPARVPDSEEAAIIAASVE